jgi:hypothetical protein
MNASLPKKMESAFWDMFIHILSESETVQNLVRNVYWLSKEKELILLGKTAGVVAAAGLISGAMTFAITVFLR